MGCFSSSNKVKAFHEEALAPGLNKEKVDLTHFEVFNQIAKSKSGRVFYAKNRLTGEWVAMKAIPGRSLNSVKADELLHERNLLPKLRSNFILNLKCSFTSDVELFLVYPLMSGGTLRSYISDRAPLPENLAKFIFAELLLSVEYMQSRKLVHRNLEPNNVLMLGSGHLKIKNFRHAQILLRENYFRTKGKVGTRGYVAPEILDGDFYGNEVDLWSISVILFELLHGKRPFPHDRDEHLDKTCVIQPRKDLSHEATSFLHSCLAYDRSKRLSLSEAFRHPFLAGLDWIELRASTRPAPFKLQIPALEQMKPQKYEPLEGPPPNADQQQQMHSLCFATDREELLLSRRELLSERKKVRSTAPAGFTSAVPVT